MRMKRLFGSLVVVALLASAMVRAHDQFRFVGSVVRVDLRAHKLTIKIEENKKLQTFSVLLTSTTEVERDGKPSTVATLRRGQSVVVDAYGDDYEGAEAQRIKIVPTLKP